MKNIKSNQNLITVLVVFSILAVALGNIGGCNGDGGGGTPFNSADPVRGGLLYDLWWAVNGAPAPTGTNPTYPVETNAEVNPPGRMGSQTWRCKECHGWDYLGNEGLYAFPNSHWTDIEGVLHEEHSPEELFDIIKFGIPGLMTDFEGMLSDEDIWDLVKFLKEGLIDDRDLVVYDTEGLIEIIEPVDLENGASLYNSTCAVCHGLDGEAMGVSLHDLVLENPVEFIHKVRFGNPGTTMPSAINNGWSLDDVKDVLAYADEVLPNPPTPTPTPTPTTTPTPTPTTTPTPTPTPGAILYQDNCQVCHGPNGEGTAIAPNIQGKSASEIQNAIDTVPLMSGIDLSPEEISAIAGFLAQ